MGIRLRVISLGAGVQSTTMALMAAHGEIEPMPDLAIFADTGWEPKLVYDHLAWLFEPYRLPFPIHIVGAGNIRDDVMAGAKGKRVANPPFYTQNGIHEGYLRRSCTMEYKIEPIIAELRSLIGLKPRQRAPKTVTAQQWIGISTDEITRAKPSRERWIEHRWPLIERGMNRWDCLRWLERKGYPEPPKSACIGCPYQSNERWRALRDRAPDEFQQAVEMDEAIRAGMRGTTSTLYLHHSRRPLAGADLSTAEERGQGNLFDNECEGICGV